MKNFYPRPPRGGRRFNQNVLCLHKDFYPRPPRGGRRDCGRRRACRSRNFYPRPPRGGRRRNTVSSPTRPVFLSTPSARRATGDPLQPVHRQGISIHALREEGDRVPVIFVPVFVYFYPRPPRGGRPADRRDKLTDLWISIHALREEGDQFTTHRRRWADYISIHALREEGDV